MKKFHSKKTHHQEEIEHDYEVSHKAKKGGKASKRGMHGHFEKKHIWPIRSEKHSGKQKI